MSVYTCKKSRGSSSACQDEAESLSNCLGSQGTSNMLNISSRKPNLSKETLYLIHHFLCRTTLLQEPASCFYQDPYDV